MPVLDTRVLVLFLYKGKLTNKTEKFQPPFPQVYFSHKSDTPCVSAWWYWKKKICWDEHGFLWGCRNSDLPPVVLYSVLPTCCTPTEQSGGLHTPRVCVWSVSALHLVWDAFQQMCMLGPTHLGTYLFCWRPWGSLEGRMLYCICRRSRLNQRWSSVTALELIVYKAAERSLLNFIF